MFPFGNKPLSQLLLMLDLLDLDLLDPDTLFICQRVVAFRDYPHPFHRDLLKGQAQFTQISTGDLNVVVWQMQRKTISAVSRLKSCGHYLRVREEEEAS